MNSVATLLRPTPASMPIKAGMAATDRFGVRAAGALSGTITTFASSTALTSVPAANLCFDFAKL